MRVPRFILCFIIPLLFSSCGQQQQQTVSPPAPSHEFVDSAPMLEYIDGIGNPYMSEDEMAGVIESVYCNPDYCDSWIKLSGKGLHFMGRTIKWGARGTQGGKTWRSASEMPPIKSVSKPLEGVRIGIDAGHIGGEWATMEYRDNMVDGKYRVREGNSTLIVAHLLGKYLEELGATVLLVRKDCTPVNTSSIDEVATKLAAKYNTVVTPELRRSAQQFFVRQVEISARAEKLRKFKPDLTVCIHFDAGNQINPLDRLHLIINGSYTQSELMSESQRRCMVSKLLEKVYPEEVGLSSSVAHSMSSVMRLEAFSYGVETESVGSVPNEPFLWRRNLLANALYPGPVIYTEPYAMLNTITARRMVVGDYEGTQVFSGKRYRSIYREYAEGITEGIKNYFLKHRRKD